MIYNKAFWLLLVCSVWTTISVLIFMRVDLPINFSHIAIVFSFLIIVLFKEKLSLPKQHAYLVCFFLLIFLLSIIKGFFIEPETVIYENKTFLNHYSYKTKDYPKFNSKFLYFKELLHLLFAILAIVVSSVIIKKCHINLETFKLFLQKYLYFLVIFYLVIYGVFYFYEDIINIISTNRHNGFRSFTSVRDQYFSKYFTYRLGITLSEPSFSGLYVLIFTPLIFLKSKYSLKLKLLVPLFFLFNSSKYVIALVLLMVLLWGILFLIKTIKSKKLFLMFPIFFLSFLSATIYFINTYWDKLSNVLSGQSGFSRIFSMKAGLHFFLDNFLLGTGIGQYPIYFVNSYGGTSLIENVLIRVPSAQSMIINGLSEFGISYILFIIFILLFLFKAYKRDKFLFYCSLILVFNLNASAGNGFNMIYYWVLLTFFTFYAWQNKESDA